MIVSGLIRPQGPPGRILVRLLRDRAFEIVASPAMLDELRRSLRYPKLRKYLHLEKEGIDLWVEALAALAVIVEGRVTERIVIVDPADDIYLAAAVDGLADYVVSGDRHLLDVALYAGIPIVSLRAFLERL